MDMLDLCRQHFQAGRHADAEQVCRQILQTDPKNAQALSALVQILTIQGKYPELAALARQIVSLEPTQVEPRLLLGGALMGLREFAEAETNYQKAAELAPTSPEPLISMGICRLCLQRFDEALPCFQKALELKPDHVQAHYFLGNCYRSLGKLAEALAAYDGALRLRPDYADAHNSRGFTLDDMRRAEEAIASFDEALRLRPDLYEAHHNRGVALGKLARYPEAIASFEQALKLVPNYPEARRNRALAILVLGDLERGWAEFEWRWKCHDLRMPKHPRPLWEGEPLDGRTILLHVEQGLGDTIQFIRYAALVKGRGGRVVVECQKPLVPLVRTCPGIDVVVPQGEPLPPFDLHTPLLRLMGLFKTRIDTIPASIPYLTADAKRVAHWREVLGRFPGFKVGIAWQGNPRHTRDADRSFPLSQFEKLASIPGVRLINLQKGIGSEQLAQLGGRFDVVDFGDKVDPGLKTMQDTPALMMSLDLIVTSDTSLAHLAGALGRPVWIALPRAPDWRWFTDREDSPWYPTARLFRQARRGEWEPVFGRIAKELETRVKSTVG